MSEKEKKPEAEAKEETTRKTIFETLQDDNIVDNCIEIFYQASQESDTPMSENQKAAMRKYAKVISSRWDGVILNLENALKDPKVKEEVMQGLRKQTRIKNKPKKKKTE